MEFVRANYLNTTTMLSIDSNTLVADRLFNRDKALQWVSDGYSGSTATTITIAFDETMSVDRIAMLNHNIKDFTIYYDGVTANTFVITGATTSTDYSSNSETSHYFTTTLVNCTSVSFDLVETIESGFDKAVGYLYVGNSLLSFDRDPSAKNYKPNIDAVEKVHTLSDGGTRIHNISSKWNVQISWDYLTTAFKNDLKTVYSTKAPFVFVPFPTTTGWDEIFFEAVWSGDFNFYQYSDNAVNAGFSGKLKLMETPY